MFKNFDLIFFKKIIISVNSWEFRIKLHNNSKNNPSFLNLDIYLMNKFRLLGYMGKKLKTIVLNLLKISKK